MGGGGGTTCVGKLWGVNDMCQEVYQRRRLKAAPSQEPWQPRVVLSFAPRWSTPWAKIGATDRRETLRIGPPRRHQRRQHHCSPNSGRESLCVDIHPPGLRSRANPPPTCSERPMEPTHTSGHHRAPRTNSAMAS